MPNISPSELSSLQQLVSEMDAEYQFWQDHHREVARYILPRRYSWLYSNPTGPIAGATAQNAKRRNETILDGTATQAVAMLAAGLMNTITSPARPWFKTRFKSQYVADAPVELQRIEEEIALRMTKVLLNSNYFQSVHTLYLDLSAFGTGGAAIYEDAESIIHCENYACGEYRIMTNDKGEVCGWSRIFSYTLLQLEKKFGLPNLTQELQKKFKVGGAELPRSYRVSHLVRPGKGQTYEEFYWLSTETSGQLLARNSYSEYPGQFPRWQVIGSDTYGTSPSMDALPDIIQLQFETKRKAQMLDYIVSPPIVADAVLSTKPNAFLPRSITYVPSSSQVGARAIYQISGDVNSITADIREIQGRVRSFYHNDLFNMISSLDTVRTAAEIQARLEEKIVQLGPVVHRLSKEVLEPGIRRVFSIMQRRGMFADLFESAPIEALEIEFSSVLLSAQRAVGTAAIERFFQTLGQVIPMAPEAANVPNFAELLKDYAARLDVTPKGLRSEQEIADIQAAQQEQQQLQQAALVGDSLTKAGANLSNMDVGGGMSALQAMLGT